MASWIERQQQDMIIVTGDGTRYFPDYLVATVNKEMEFNISKFEFKGVAKSLVVRSEPMSMSYDMEIIFQGARHLDTSDAFLKSATNKKAWKITHPLYGGLTVQPVNLRFNNTSSNITRLGFTVIETIGSGVTTPIESAPDTVSNMVTAAIISMNTSTVLGVRTPPQVSYLKGLLNHINAVLAFANKYLKMATDEVNTLTNYYNAANRLVNNTIFQAQQVAGTVAALLITPATFADTIANRINMFELQLASFIGDALVVNNVYSNLVDRLQQKLLFENNGGIMIAAICLSSVTNITSDYDNRDEVLAVITSIIDGYNGYVSTLSDVQDTTGGGDNSYIPNPDALIALEALVNYTIGNLFDIANNAKQQRSYTLTQDSNVTLIAWQLLGLVADDSTIDALIAQNKIVGYELFSLQKGREIIYYV